jgi:hypothetical protein
MKTKKNTKLPDTLKMYWYSKTIPFYCAEDQDDSKQLKTMAMMAH